MHLTALYYVKHSEIQLFTQVCGLLFLTVFQNVLPVCHLSKCISWHLPLLKISESCQVSLRTIIIREACNTCFFSSSFVMMLYTLCCFIAKTEFFFKEKKKPVWFSEVNKGRII